MLVGGLGWGRRGKSTKASDSVMSLGNYKCFSVTGALRVRRGVGKGGRAQGEPGRFYPRAWTLKYREATVR